MRAIRLQTISDARGNLTVAEKLTFPIRRAYWLHSVDPLAKRGGHAHRKLDRLMIAVHGRFLLSVDGSFIVMNNPSVAIHLPPMAWVELSEFSADAVCLVLASEEHDEADCIRDFDEFRRLR